MALCLSLKCRRSRCRLLEFRCLCALFQVVVFFLSVVIHSWTFASQLEASGNTRTWSAPVAVSVLAADGEWYVYDIAAHVVSDSVQLHSARQRLLAGPVVGYLAADFRYVVAG
jgi:hypothetical protein